MLLNDEPGKLKIAGLFKAGRMEYPRPLIKRKGNNSVPLPLNSGAILTFSPNFKSAAHNGLICEWLFNASKLRFCITFSAHHFYSNKIFFSIDPGIMSRGNSI
jgi:hypothetical protein